MVPMKPGDLVRMINGEQDGRTVWLYGGDERPWDENTRLIPSDVPFRFSQIALVLKNAPDPVYEGFYLYLKVLAPEGVGWVHQNMVEVVG